MARYINISIPPGAHGKLKRLAKAKGVSMACYVSTMVNFFSQTGRDPEDIAPINGQMELAKVKTRLEQISRLIKGQEKQLFSPVAEAVFGMEKSMAGALSASKLIMLLQSELICPRCGAAFSSFEQTEDSFRCASCHLKLGMRIGQYALTLPDLVTLLSGGMTRVLDKVELPNLGKISGRYFLSSDHEFELQLYEHQYHPL